MTTDITRDTALTLVMAVITSSPAPLVLLDGGLNVVVASASFCVAFEVDCIAIVGHPFLDIGHGEWDLPGLGARLAETAAGGPQIKAYALDLMRPGTPLRRVEITAHKLDYADVAQVRLMVGAMDITDRAPALSMAALHREMVVLLQEVRHRIANSLQIIASVLLLTANRTTSEEVRAQLNDAYLRVMSVATLERQLAHAAVGDVTLAPYFATLCENIGASMISDPDRITLALQVDESVVPAEVSVSLGLIVTELVINALKHAFPGGRSGEISISYRSDATSTVLRVSDNGVGRGRVEHAPGLGAMIVDALARQHGARVDLSDANPGTTVSIVFN